MEFDAAVFTNLTQDHLDYHKTMEAYFEAKDRLFAGLADAEPQEGQGDHQWRRPLRRAARREVQGPDARDHLRRRACARISGPAISASISTAPAFNSMRKERSYLVRLPLIGHFNVYNSLAAIAPRLRFGHRGAHGACWRWPTRRAVPGRMEAVPAQRAFRIFVDYAHTDDALINVHQDAARAEARAAHRGLRLRRQSRPRQASAHGRGGGCSTRISPS